MRQRATWGKSRTKVEEARELLAGVMLAHVPVSRIIITDDNVHDVLLYFLVHICSSRLIVFH